MIRTALLTVAGFLLAEALTAQTPPSAQSAPPTPTSIQALEALPPIRDHFPADYIKTACAPEGNCRSFDLDKMSGAAKSFLGFKLSREWVEKHSGDLLDDFAPICEKHSSCLGTLGNSFLFCDDVVTQEFRNVCDRRYPRDKMPTDWDQCKSFAEIYALGVDTTVMKLWQSAQECAAHSPRVTGDMDVWTEPTTISPDNKGYITFYAIDTKSHIPIAAEVRFLSEIIFDPANPTGTTATYYPFKYTPKFHRIPNAEGHQDLVPSLVTIDSPYYPKVTMSLPIKVPQMIVQMSPPRQKLKPGRNTVTISARDAETGKPVELRVMVGDRWAGDSDKPFELTMPRRAEEMPEVWVTSLFDHYSDKVVVPRAGVAGR